MEPQKEPLTLWVARHGETGLNRRGLMQGLTDEPLNQRGIAQALDVRGQLAGRTFTAVYSSPLQRALQTAEILSGLPAAQIIRDDRLREVDFGRYEGKHFSQLGSRFSLYWLFPDLFPAPDTVETPEAMIRRSTAFLSEVQAARQGDVLIVCHGGIMRALCGCLEGRKNGIAWQLHPKNCEVRVYQWHPSGSRPVQILKPSAALD